MSSHPPSLTLLIQHHLGVFISLSLSFFLLSLSLPIFSAPSPLSSLSFFYIFSSSPSPPHPVFLSVTDSSEAALITCCLCTAAQWHLRVLVCVCGMFTHSR